MNRPRRSQAEMRRILLDAGSAILGEEGLQTGSTNVTFKRVFDRVESETGQRFTNASVIRRIWENQADFQSDVLLEAARVSTRPEAVTAIDLIEEGLRSLDLTTAQSRDHAIQQICRTGGNESAVAVERSPTWELWISVIAMAIGTTSTGQQEKVKSALAIGHDEVTTFWSERFIALIDVLGYRLRPPFTMGELVRAVIAYSEGCALQQKSVGSFGMTIRPTGPNGEDQEWTLFAVGLEALVGLFLEADSAKANY